MKINDYTFEEKQTALDEAFAIMNADKTNAERLGIILERYKKYNGLKTNDYKWLFEQAERAQELQKDNKRLDYMLGQTYVDYLTNESVRMQNKLHEVGKENMRFREALEEVFELSKHDNQSRYLDKCYVVARQALEAERRD